METPVDLNVLRQIPDAPTFQQGLFKIGGVREKEIVISNFYHYFLNEDSHLTSVRL